MNRMVLAVVAAVLLAGCSDGKGGGGNNHAIEGKVGDDFRLQEGKGAIAGLLVDDRFRPIQVQAEPTDAGQVRGFVLLQETGAQVGTNGNGEFAFVDLDPGTYRLRATVEGHEAVPQTVVVEAGAFTEAPVVARRVVNQNGTILTQEYSVFKACEATLVVIGTPLPCTLDLSGDTDRDNFQTDYSEFADATYLVTEFQASQRGFYEIRVGPRGEIGGCDNNYAIEEIVDGSYLKIINQKGEPREENHLTCGNGAWQNDGRFTTMLYIDGAYKGAVPVVGGFGVGVFLAVEGKFVQSVFLGEPEVDIGTYCVLCGG